MTEPLVTRGELKDLDLAAPWMLVSGWVGLVGSGIQLYVPTESGSVVRLSMDLHDAGELYVALEAHMENVAAPATPAPMTPEERDRALRVRRINGHLKAVREQIDKPLVPPKSLADDPGMDPEWDAAVEDVLEAWTNNGPHARTGHGGRVQEVRDAFPALAAALDRLAALNA